MKCDRFFAHVSSFDLVVVSAIPSTRIIARTFE